MKLYRRRPECVEAVMWDGTNVDEVRKLVGDLLVIPSDKTLVFVNGNDYVVRADVGHWIVRGANGQVVVRGANFTDDYALVAEEEPKC